MLNDSQRIHPPHRLGTFALSLGLVCASLLGLVSTIQAAPEPEPIPRRWEFKIEPGELRLACIDVPTVGPQAFFYFTYKVTNTSSQDRFFAPSFELASDRGEIIRSGRDVPPMVSDVLLARINRPFLSNEIDVQGLLLQGKENAREGLVIWRADDLLADEITIYAAGFSGETRSITRPDTGEPVLLRKTLMLKHLTPGDLDCRDLHPIEREETRWIMRSPSAR